MVPDAGYAFAGWTGDYTGPENPLILTNVTSDMNVVAAFAVIEPPREDDNGAGNAPDDESPADQIPAEEEIGTDTNVPAKVDTDDGDGGGGGGGSCFIGSIGTRNVSKGWF